MKKVELECLSCGSNKKVEWIQQKKGDPLEWGTPWPACLKCRKKAMGSYRLVYVLALPQYRKSRTKW